MWPLCLENVVMKRAMLWGVALCILLLCSVGLAEEKSAGGQSQTQTRSNRPGSRPRISRPRREPSSARNGRPCPTQERAEARAKLRERLGGNRPGMDGRAAAVCRGPDCRPQAGTPDCPEGVEGHPAARRQGERRGDGQGPRRADRRPRADVPETAGSCSSRECSGSRPFRKGRARRPRKPIRTASPPRSRRSRQTLERSAASKATIYTTRKGPAVSRSPAFFVCLRSHKDVDPAENA